MVMNNPIGRITMNNLVFAIYWNSLRKETIVYDVSGRQMEHIDIIPGNPELGETVLDLIDRTVRYGYSVGHKIDDINIG